MSIFGMKWKMQEHFGLAVWGQDWGILTLCLLTNQVNSRVGLKLTVLTLRF